MFGLGMPEILMILAIALIVIGPKKLPELAKTLGRALGEFKRSAQDFKRSIDVETTVKDIKDIADPETDLKEIIKDANIKDETTATSREDSSSQDSQDGHSKEVPDNNTDDTPVDKEPDKTD
ncbi:twin-arginine translocase TatA/TatE family subunit [Desulfobacula sp.]|uniref:twin-arginine translocase TatA/TatE family subunit n=1 Tax=Desulfobacula sp. TaxID=2593537 RepID=UPI0025BDAA5A|nr:twin-arginine translocase TatA/TatE family subunit [Desulfobacula sp.]MBC2705201.1 twin-arginine translocase TatA/TatE family subunit [Desulfobacula sp.]